MSLTLFTGVLFTCSPVYAAAENNNYSLSGAKYQLYTDKACTKKAMDLEGNNALLTTTSKGGSNKLKMDPGTYYAKEITASKGYKLDTKIYTVKITTENTSSDPATFTSKEPPLYGEPYFRVYKTSSDSTYTGYERLLGAEFTVKYYDVSSKEDIASAKPKDQWVFVTTKKSPPASETNTNRYYAGFDWQTDEPVSYKHEGTGKFYQAGGKRVLPLGYFTIEETKAPAGFKRSEKIYYGRVVKSSTTGEAVTKIGDDVVDSSHVKELVVSNEPYVTSVKKTNSSTGAVLAGAKMQVLRGETVVHEWLTTSKEQKFTDLEPGNYVLRELSAPYGYDISDDVSFTVKKDANTAVVMKNTPVTITTTAVDKETENNIGCISENETVRDTVKLTGLKSGRNYRVSGILTDKASGAPIKNSDGSDVTASKEFRAEGGEMTVTVEFSVDSSSFDPGTQAVVYEKLERTSAVHKEKVPVEIQKHENPDDTAQTISYPGIKTTASIQKNNREVKDVVTYQYLLPNKNYVIRGWLVDTVTGEKVPDSDGSVPLQIGDKTSGEAEMILNTEKYDDMTGHSLTAFEELYLVESSAGTDKEILIAEHKDINDEDQTVGIYQDLKVKKNVTGNLGDLTKVFEYKAVFTGLVPDTAYTIEGDDTKTFMSDPSGKATVPIKLKDDESVTIRQLPKSSQYQITEKASDHVAEFKVFSEDMAEKGARIIQASGSNNEEASKTLSTALETVDLFDGTVVVLWENNRDLATLTAARSYLGIWACSTVLVLAALVILMVKRGNYKED